MVVRHTRKQVSVNGSTQPQMITVNDPHHGEITISYELMSPITAQAWLEKHNARNRRINHRHVETLARAMTNREWVTQTDAIGFDVNGQICNGQHRLSAVVASRKAQTFIILRGLNTNTFDYIDMTRKRNAADLLDRIGQYVSTSALGAALRLLLIYRQTGHFNSPNVNYSNTEIVSHLENEPGLEHAIERAQHFRREGLTSAPPALVAALYQIFSGRAPAHVEPFMERWATGLGIYSKADPVYALRRRLDDPAVSTRNDIAACAIHAWNKYRTNQEITYLRIPREFPKPI